MQAKNDKEIDRRTMITLSVAAGGAALLTPALKQSASGQDSPKKQTGNPIVVENSRPGTRKWMLENTRIEPASKYRCPWIEGYVSHASILPGETLKVMVSTNPASDFTIEFFRLGYYGGEGGRQVHATEKLPGGVQAMPEIGPLRLQNCEWKPSYELRIPEDWVSGVYVGKLTELSEGSQSYVIFVVRDNRKADFVFQVSDHTWQAYNRWPSQFSLYDDGVNQWHWGDKSRVSFNRPYGKYCQIFDAPLSTGSGEFFLWEFPFVFWLEEHGYDVTYISNTDLHRDAEQPKRCKGFISVGHDEYWSIDMFEHMQSAIASGVNVGFFSGNAVCGRVEWDAARVQSDELECLGHQAVLVNLVRCLLSNTSDPTRMNWSALTVQDR